MGKAKGKLLSAISSAKDANEAHKAAQSAFQQALAKHQQASDLMDECAGHMEAHQEAFGEHVRALKECMRAAGLDDGDLDKEDSDDIHNANQVSDLEPDDDDDDDDGGGGQVSTPALKPGAKKPGQANLPEQNPNATPKNFGLPKEWL